MTQPTNSRAIDENGGLRWGKPPTAISLPARIGAGSDLVQTLDYVVLIQCLHSVTEGSNPTPLMVWELLKARGIRSSKNVNELVGKNAVYDSFGRLIAKGYIRRVEIPNEVPGRRPTIGYEVFDDPAGNPDWQAAQVADACKGALRGSEKAQVSPLPGTPDVDRYRKSTFDVSAGQSTSRNAGRGVPASGVPGSGARRIPAGQPTSGVPGSGNAAPPTPPHREEEDSSSHKSSSVSAVAAGAQATDATAVEAAAEFLAELPGRWACGRKSAAELAPLLAEATQEQGWELNADLVQQLARRAPARRTSLSVLRERIEDLPRYRAARKALELERAHVAAARVPGQQLVLDDDQHSRSDAVPPLPEGVTPERVKEARAFLLTLTGPWAIGPETAVRLAPQLAAKTAERGWGFDSRLLAQLMSNPNGVNNYELVLERHRIGNLPFRRNTVGGQRSEVRDERQKAIDACGVCDSYGQFERNGAVVLCRHDETQADIAPEQGGVPTPASTAEHEGQGPDVPRAPGNLADLLASMRKSPV